MVELGPELTLPAATIIDAAGQWVFPAVIDAHVHFNDPGRTAWEGVATGSAALAAGGGGTFFDMPLNASPPTLDGASFDVKKAVCDASSLTDYALWGGLTPANLDRMPELAERGVIGFKAFMSNSGIEDFACCDDATLYRGMEIAAGLGLPVAVHAESDALTSAWTRQARDAGKTGVRDYLNSRPIVCELEAIQRALLFARETKCKLHVVHVSSERGVEHLRKYRDAFGVDVTCETCPHYLLLDDAEMERIGAPAKCAPPLRPAAERDALIGAVKDWRVDIVGSDHSPAPAEMKTAQDFFAVWGGIAGVQSTLPALLSIGVSPGRVAALTAANVANRFRIANKGSISLGNDADLALIDVAAQGALTRDELLDRHKLSPYVGREFRCRAVRTIVRGRVIFENGRIVAAPQAKFLRPAPAPEEE
ncbi:MAG: allantoinase AllB [Pirellulales bacterium]